MRKYLTFLLLLLLVVSGCGKREKTVLTIGDIKITGPEFERAFKSSSFAGKKDEGRALFLDSYISKKLILKEAERLGLDKDEEFLSDIQSFWEQALLKSIISRKSKELAATTSVSDQEIKDYYNAKKASEFSSKELPEVYDRIKWLLLQRKQTQAMSQWLDSLKARMTIIVDPEILKVKDQKKR